MKDIVRAGLGLGSLLVVAALLPACDKSEAGSVNPTAEVAIAERRDLEIKAEAVGLVEPIRIVEVKSKASGEVLELRVETGDYVERGELLAEIDPRDVRNGLLQAQADLEVAEARQRTAAAQLERSAELRAANVITEQEYESAQLELANANTQLVKARTNLELAQERMNDVRITAPIGGTIITKSVEVGTIIASASQNVSGGTTLLEMADLSQMHVRTLVDEVDVGKIVPGLSARVTVSAYPNRVFVGEVLKIEPQAVVEQNVTMFPVLIQLDNRDGLLKPGMNAEVAVEIARREGVVTVPNAAVVSMRDAMPAGLVLGLPEETLRSMLGGGRMGGQRPDGAPRGEGPTQSALGDMPAGPGLMRPEPSTGEEIRPGVVFVQTAEGPVLRRVSLGVNDWDDTEVIEGLEAGEEVILISVARIQQQQQQMLDRMRRMSGGPFPGTSRR